VTNLRKEVPNPGVRVDGEPRKAVIEISQL
jgi:hypothetical protein